jgi:hypothetical protein
MRRAARVFAGLATAVGVVTGCSSTDDRPSYPLPDDGWHSGDPAHLAGAGGEFHATRVGHRACATIGPTDVPFSYSWPTGYRVRFHPTQLLDPSGHVVAEEGDHVKSGGGFTGQLAGGTEPPTRPIVTSWCGRPGKIVFAIQGGVRVVK